MDVEIRSRLIVGWPEVVKPTSGFGRQPQGFVVHDGAARPEPTLPRLTRSETAPRRPEVRNIGDAKIRQGTQVVWQIRETGEHGSFFVPLDLLPGDEVPDLAALAAGIPKTNHCFSNIA